MARSRRRADTVRLLVTLGAADVARVTGCVVEGVAAIPGVAVTAVMPSGQDQSDDLKTSAASQVTVLDHVLDFAALVAQTDIAIAGVGVSLWELACAGVPTLMVSTTDRQREVGRAAAEYGAHTWIGDAHGLTPAIVRDATQRLIADASKQEEMSRLGRTLIDGRGAARVASAMLRPAPDWTVRLANGDDAEAVWEIASDPAVRQMSLATAPFSFTSHEAWFSRKLRENTSRIWVFEKDGSVAAYVRCELLTSEEATLSIAVAAPFRGQGIGTRLVSETARLAGEELAVERIQAVVKTGNVGSRRVFARAGYRDMGERDIDGHRCVVFERSLRSHRALA